MTLTQTTYLTCDGCEECIEPNKAEDSKGWITAHENTAESCIYTHYCPDCVKLMREALRRGPLN